ncbi:MAG: ABC transporter substrate-binding protein [Micromonosporaceae bacterium]
MKPWTRCHPKKQKLKALAFVAALATSVSLAGCASGGSVADEGEASGGNFPVSVKGAAGKVTLKSKPDKIVSLSPTGTEMLYAVGAGKQVVAADDQSTYPKQAPRTKLSGFKPNADAVAGYEPDLVVLAYDANDVVSGLKKLKIPVYVAPAAESLEDSYQQMENLGKLTGHTGGATDAVDQMKSDIDKLVKDLPQRDEELTYYHELDPQLNSATSKTFIGEVYGLAGLKNIADSADKEGSGYPQLSAEHLIDSDPDLVFLADTKCCGQSPEKVADRPGWDKLTAVKQGQVHALDDDIASRWGPRVVDLLRVVSEAVAAVPA